MKNKAKVIVGLLLIISMSLSICMSPIQTEAADRFPGVQILVNQTTINDPFKILEVVADEDDASIGFYIKGSEPFGIDEAGNAITFDKMIRSISTAEDRETYIEKLLSRLDGKYYLAGQTTGNPEDYPLIYSEYMETFFLTDGNAVEWNQVTLDYVQTVTLKGSYVETELDAEGNREAGDYVKNDNVYSIDPEGDGEFVENIEQFVLGKAPKQYNVTFAPIPADYANDEEIVAAINEYGVYLPMNEDTTTEYFYNGATVDENSSELTFYYVQDYEFVKETDAGTYGIIVNENEPYISSPGTGTHNKEEDAYTLLEGLGDYNFIPDENGTEEYLVEVNKYFYKGGFTNNNWFKRDVLLFSDTEISSNAFPILVKTVTVDQLTENIFEDMDMLVISCDDEVTESEDDLEADLEKFNTHLDVNELNALVTKINRAKFPCVINSELMDATLNPQFYEYMEAFYKTADDDANFIVDSVYWHTGDILNKDFNTAISNVVGFEDIASYLNTENAYRTLNGLEELKRSVSQAVAIEYVLGRQSARNISAKESLTVLEIEPCADYFFVKEDGQTSDGKDKVRALLGYSETQMPDDNIQIDQMTTAEFIGKIEDLNGKYDFIYIGMETGLMNVKTVDGKTVTQYNDSSMNGYVYTHTGDLMIASERITGLMENDYIGNDEENMPFSEDVYKNRTEMVEKTDENGNTVKELVMNEESYTRYPIKKSTNSSATSYASGTYKNTGVYRYSGNDITEEKMEDLEEFIAAGYPIILDNDFFVSKNGKRVIDETKIDNSSYLYEFLEAVWNRDNLFFYDDISPTSTQTSTKEDFQFYMSIPKLKINFSSTPANALDNRYVVADENGKYYLSYTFSVSDEAAANPADTLYTATLYVDMNSDGKFSGTTETLSDATVIDLGTGKTIANNQLLAGRYYTLKREIPKGFRSIVPWKLEVSQTPADNQTEVSLIRKSEQGYAGLDIQGEKEVIDVLQLTSNSGNVWNIGSDSAFKTLAASIKDFSLNVRTMSVAQYEAQKEESTYIEFLNKYDMLVLGFADTYGDFDKLDSVNAILQYINSGKSVLFTHDTTSFNNSEHSQVTSPSGTVSNMDLSNYRWGYLYNRWLRNILGMDRYGIVTDTKIYGDSDVTARSILTKGNILNKYNADGSLNAEFKAMEDSGKDIAYVAGTNRTQAYPETQGFNYLTLNTTFAEVASSRRSTYYNLTKNALGGNDVDGDQNNGSYSTMHVTNVNKGQITSYPFELPDKFQVARTHGQYYQLDLRADRDRDGESDIVVWYCISNAENENTIDMYSASPNDVSNNYFIYSIGNVFYTGVGHSNLRSVTPVEKDYERQLFINTMVAAYSASITDPLVDSLSEENTEAQSTSTIRLPIEATMIDGTLAESYLSEAEVQFFYKVEDTNFVNASVGGSNQKDIHIRYYLKSSDAERIPGFDDVVIYGVDITDQLTTKINGEPVNVLSDGSHEVESGKAYTAEWKDNSILVEYLKDNPSVSIYIVVSSTFDHYGEKVPHYGYDIIHIKKTNLFNLD